MDKLDRYRDAIENKLREFVPGDALGLKQTRDQVVFDRQHDNYLVFREGWDGSRRIHHVIVHLEIMNGKILIHEDWTEYGIARELEDEGIPKSDMVLSFQPPEVRHLTDYAVAA